MSLGKQQDLIARLYCDAEFRVAFMAAPLENGRGAGLADERLLEIASAIPDEIEYFARTLIWKRRSSVEKMLPLTSSLLGPDFGRIFAEFAPEFQSETVKKHLEEALAFTGFVDASSEDPEIRAAARYERARLRFYSEERRFSACVVTASVRKRVAGESGSSDKGRRMIALWIRIGRRIRHFFL